MTEWVKAALLEEIPEDTGLAVRINGQDIALFRMDECIYALENLCPHREGPIADGELEDGVVTCPWHAWQIDVRSGEVVYNANLKAHTFPCRISSGEVQIEI